MSSSRVSHACRACAKARVKCEETKPCSRCRARNISCQPSLSTAATTAETALASLSGFEPGGPPSSHSHGRGHGHGHGHDHGHSHVTPLLSSSYQTAYGPESASMMDPALAFQSYPMHFSMAGSSTTGITSHAPMPYTTTSAYAPPTVMSHVAPDSGSGSGAGAGPNPNPEATSAAVAVTAAGASFSMAYYPHHHSHHHQQHPHLGLHTAVPGFTGSQTDSGAPGPAANGVMGRSYREPYTALDAGWPANPTAAGHGQGVLPPDMTNAWAYDDFDLQNLRHW